ncbi:hypothetical protein ASPTUDRAFT_51555, partial [Aspergillus tubingensis CBS 134.48]
MPPTIFAGVNDNMIISHEETFGLVVIFAVFETEEQAIRMANHSVYGLQCSISTQI